MKSNLLTIAITGALLTSTAFAANTNGYPEYPASAEYQRIYKHEQYWKSQNINQSPQTTTEARCSDYPKSAEYKRAARRMGIKKKCND